MPILSNPRHEKFAEELAQGKSATEAYSLAGFSPSRRNASRLKSNEDVRQRVAEIQSIGAKSAEVSVTSLLTELETARQQATDYRQLSAAIRAIEMKGKVSGVLVERSQVQVTGPDYDQPKSIEELCRRMADERLDGLTNARWLPISDQDRQQLAEIIARWFAEMQDFVDEVNSRPLLHTNKIEPPQRMVTNGKGEPKVG